MRSVVLAAAAAIFASAPGRVAAQDTTVAIDSAAAAARDSLRAVQDSVARAEICDGHTISTIDIEPEPPRMIGRGAPAWRRAVLGALVQHSTTRPEVVSDFLELEEGELCTDLRRAESERRLRAQPFIANASVVAEPDTNGTVRIIVRTVDEIPLIIGLNVSGGGVRGLKYGNSNVRGTGVLGTASWQNGGTFHDGFGARLTDYHVFNGPFALDLNAERQPLGHVLSASLAYPFFTALQHSAWHVGFDDTRRYPRFLRTGEDALSLKHERQIADIGAVARIGGRLGRIVGGIFGGALLTYERSEPAREPVVVTDSGLLLDFAPELVGRYAPYKSTRVSGVLGLRLLNYVRARGFDALVGEQDVARGFQIATIVGRSTPWFGATDRDDHISTDIYAGAGTARWFVGMQADGEGRHDRDAGRWDAIVASGRLAWYLKLSERNTWITSAEYSGAWRERLPYQLTFAERDGGLRGFRGTTTSGGRRAALRVERRRVLGPGGSRRLQFGVAGFADAGKLWAGDVPFGTTTGIRGSLGLALLAALPAESQRLFRLDVAAPVTTGASDNWQVRFYVSRSARRFWREPGDLARARAAAPASGIFAWQ